MEFQLKQGDRIRVNPAQAINYSPRQFKPQGICLTVLSIDQQGIAQIMVETETGDVSSEQIPAKDLSRDVSENPHIMSVEQH